MTIHSLWNFNSVADNQILVFNGSGLAADKIGQDVQSMSWVSFQGGTLDNNGKGGAAYDPDGAYDAINNPGGNVEQNNVAGNGVGWNSIRYDGAGNVSSASFTLDLDTRGWTDLSLRMNYRSQIATNYDLSYSLDGGASWLSITNDGTLTSGYTSFGSTVINGGGIDLSSVTAIEDKASVLLRFDDFARNSALTPAEWLDDDEADRFVIDNLALSGTIDGNPATNPSSIAVTKVNDGWSGVVGATDNSPLSLTGVGTATDILSLETSNGNVLDAGTDIDLWSDGTTRTFGFRPAGRGVTDVALVSRNDSGDITSATAFQYGAVAAGPSSSRWHLGRADASAAIAISPDLMLVANDEDAVIRLYRRDANGAALTESDLTADLDLGGDEADFEAAVRVGDTIYWAGSHSNSSDGDQEDGRERIVATTITGEGVGTGVAYTGRYDHLVTDLVAWDNANGHGLGIGYLGLENSEEDGVEPELPNGFSIEGMTFAPDDTTAWVAFRAPLESTTDRDKALIIPVTNLPAILDSAGGTAGDAEFGAPILLDLGGRAIRDIVRNEDGDYVILAGPPGAASSATPNDFRLFVWNGNANSAPVQMNNDLRGISTGRGADGGGSLETIVAVPDDLGQGSRLQLLSDNGDTFAYSGGVESKDFGLSMQRFRSDWISLSVPGSSNGGGGTPTTPTNGGADTMTGTDGGDRVDAGNGSDRVESGAGADTVLGGLGNDTVMAGSGDDLVTAGQDTDLVYGNQGDDIVYGNQGSDTLFGGQGGDHVFGGQDDDAVYGNLGDDFVYGNAGDDTLFGGRGDDALFGGQGNDLLFGGLGADSLGGGLGTDRFVFAAGGGADTVTDFSIADGDLLVAGGRSWTVASGSNGAVVSFGSGDSVTLVNVRADQVTASLFAAS